MIECESIFNYILNRSGPEPVIEERILLSLCNYFCSLPNLREPQLLTKKLQPFYLALIH